MPKRKTKQFIDKKNSVTFQLVHRSQKDPLAADESAPQKVLVPINDKKTVKHENNAISNVKKSDKEHNYEVVFDKDYDYLHHLQDVTVLTHEWEKAKDIKKDVKTDEDEEPSCSTKINLPSSVFESNIQEETGLLNRDVPVSGPLLCLDPDIVAALDDDFDFDDPENQLEDDFITLANAGGNKDDVRDVLCDDDLDSNYDEEDMDSLGSLERTFRNEETKSHFTEYSMSSSVMRRNAQLSLLDDQFEKMYADYEENEIGGLDDEDIEGTALSSDLMEQCAQEFENEKIENEQSISDLIKNKMKIEDANMSGSDENENDMGLEKLVIEVKEKNNWDCQSVLSNYSNIYNHPKLISEPKSLQKLNIDSKTGIPKNTLGHRQFKPITIQALNEFDATYDTFRLNSKKQTKNGSNSVHSFNIRPKTETLEEKKQRKQELKNYRRQRREERKINIQSFKDEKKRQEKVMMNEKNNVQGNRIL